MHNQAPDSPQESPQNDHSQSLAWFVLIGIGLLLLTIIFLRPKPVNGVTDIPYSAFLDQVRADNVVQVEITGDQIIGLFRRPVVWAVMEPTDGQQAGDGSASQSYDNFRTIYPETPGDPSLLPLLTIHQVEVNVTRQANGDLYFVFLQLAPLLLLLGLIIWWGRRTMAGQSSMTSFTRTRARRYSGEQSLVTFADVAGADEAKRELQEVVDFLRYPLKYSLLGARIPRGTLLIGPPGTGKTLLAQAVAGEAGVPFFNLSASEFVEMFVGVGASRVRDLFELAKTAGPSIIFIDELDAVGRRRGAGLGHANDEREQTLNQLLAEMDGFDKHQEIVVLAATNRPDVLDPALLRPGRFDRQVMVDLPDRRGREAILRVHTRSLPLAAAVDLPRLAAATTGFSGADLANLCNEAALCAARYNRQEVMMDDFEEAQDKLLLGGVRPLLLGEAERRVIAYHEAGHALVAWLLPAADPIYKVSIIPRGKALGVTEQIPGEDRYNHSRTYLLARLAVLLGGRAAEEIVLGDITTGAENDLQEAARLARRMVTRWGMGNLGIAAIAAAEPPSFLGYDSSYPRDYSEATAARIDQDVQTLLAERQETVRRLLTEARQPLDVLAQALLEAETIDHQALARLLNPRPEPVQKPCSEAISPVLQLN